MKLPRLPDLATLSPRALLVAAGVGLIAWTALTVYATPAAAEGRLEGVRADRYR